MEQHLTLFVWFTGILTLTVLTADTLLVFKFRRYFHANGFGLVTLTLLSFVAAHLIGAISLGITSIVVIATNGQSDALYYPSINIISYWLNCTSLFHVAGITFQRLFSFSFGNRFLSFSHSKTNIVIFIVFMWMTCFFTTLLCTVSTSPATNAVFFIGFIVTGTLTVFNFLITIETSFFKANTTHNQQKFERREKYEKLAANHASVVQNPRKTFSLFAGLVLSFMLFNLPSAIPNLIFSLRNKLLISSTSLVISLWLLLGVVFNSVWLLVRLRSTVNDTSGFYAKWSVHKKRENVSLVLRSAKRHKDLRLLNNEDDDFMGSSKYQDTEHGVV